MTATPAYVSRFLVPKDGHDADQCEDALVVSPLVECDQPIADAFLAVLCDGASESLLARDWARLLAEELASRVERRPRTVGSPTAAANAIAAAARGWDSWLASYLERRENGGKPVAWYEKPGLERGAYATALAVSVRADEKRWRWNAAALGDTCLFHVRGDRLLYAFPVSDPVDFGVTPALAGSRNHDAALLARHVKVAAGECESGDALFMATDALAAWFLTSTATGKQPWNLLREFAGREPSEFEDFIASLRSVGDMRNDDVAFVHFDIG
ncbi:hypothetical protein [Catenulispora rubra]|uniref:hypothetical protein n=1 Tax=Catenulispora rubra TaxID=280293 RepID=UPI0018920A4B|nr:hypothetical protein [Catenulispora rubra]